MQQRKNELYSPLRYLGNRGPIHAGGDDCQLKDIMTMVESAKKIRGKPFGTVYDLFSGSGSISLAFMQSDVAERYVVNDLCPELSFFWNMVKTNPEHLIQAYDLYVKSACNTIGHMTG